MNYCFALLKKSITKTEEDYGAVVVGFVSDNEAKMVALRKVHKIASNCYFPIDIKIMIYEYYLITSYQHFIIPKIIRHAFLSDGV